MLDYCTVLLNPSTKSDILAACIQAAAAIRAGNEQADASRFSGWLTLLAGTFALVSAVVAYHAAIRQVRLAERQNILRAKAFRRSLIDETIGVEIEIKNSLLLLRMLPIRSLIDRECLPKTQRYLDKLSPQNWHGIVHAGDLFDDLDAVTFQVGILLHHWNSLITVVTGAVDPLEHSDPNVKEMIEDLNGSTDRARKALQYLRKKVQTPPSRWRNLLLRLRHFATRPARNITVETLLADSRKKG